MGQLKIITDLVKNPQKIYLSYNQRSDTWYLRVGFNGKFQTIPYGLGSLVVDNESLDLDVRIEVLSCPVARFLSYLSDQLDGHDFVYENFELRFDGVVIDETTGHGNAFQGPAYITTDIDIDSEETQTSFDCYGLDPRTGWSKITSNSATLRGELRITRHFYYDIQE